MALYKRAGTKYYWMKFTLNGVLYQQSTKIKNRRDAEAYEAAFRTGLQHATVGLKPKREIPLFAKAVEDYLAKLKSVRSKDSYHRWESDCKKPKVFFAKKSVDEINLTMLEDYRRWRCVQLSKKTGQPITNDTINREMVVTKQILRDLVAREVIPIDRTRGIRSLPANEPAFHVITDAEEVPYLMACSPQLQDVATIILQSGMRPKEVCSIRREDLHLDQDFLQIIKGKTPAARRRIYLTDVVKTTLLHRLKRFDGAFLFPQNDIDGEPSTDTNALDYRHRIAVRSLGFDFRLYDCRHTFATRAHEAGIDLLTLAAILGHSSLKMVTRYAHPAEERKANALKSMQRSREEKRSKAV